MTTLSEAIALLQQKENKFFRINDRIERLSQETFSPEVKPETQEQFEQREAEFIREQVDRIRELEEERSKLVDQIVELKTVINEANVAEGQVSRLTERRFVKERLKHYMEILDGSDLLRRASNRKIVDSSGLHDRVDELETEKNELDKAIQHTNHTTEVSLSFT